MDAIVEAEVRTEPEAPPPYLDPDLVAKHGRFLSAARRWVEAGANVAPMRPGTKKPAIEGWGNRPGKHTGAWLVRDWGLDPAGGPLHSKTSPKIPLDRLRDWARDYMQHGCLIFPATLDATVIDVDDMRVFDAVIEACGDTPYRTISGRAGGGVHLWYAGSTHSKNGIVPGVDVKSTGGYVIAPGSIHERTGHEYSASPALHDALERGALRFPELRADWRERLKRATAGVVRPTRLDLAQLVDTLRDRPKSREIAKRLRFVADGKEIADHGERDSVLYACLATLAEQWPHAEGDAIVSLFGPSLALWQQDDEREGRVDTDWEGIALDKWERVAGEQDERHAELDERDIERRRTAWHLVDVDSDAAADPAQPIVVHKGKTYYMRIGHLWYGPITRDDIGADTMAALRALYTIDCQDFTALLAAHGKPVREIRYSYTIEHTVLKRGVLIVRAAPVRDLTPAYSETVERGIDALCGGHAASFRHWVGGLLRQDKPCRALILSGDRGLGKSMLLDGLARLWFHGKAEMHHVVGRRFNDSVLETPYVVADDSTAPSEQGLSLAMYLRQAVSERTQKFEKKHLDIAKIDGSLRFAIGTNDAMELVQGAVSHKLNDASVAAFAERLLHIPLQAEGAGWWMRDMLPGETEAERTERLVSGDEIAKHALWLMQQPENMQPRGRFWLEAADESLHKLAVFSSGLRGDILLRLATEAPGVKHDGARVLVQTRIFVEGWSIDRPRGLGLRSGGLALKALAQAVDVGAAPPSTTPTVAISLPLVRWYAERCGL